MLAFEYEIFKATFKKRLECAWIPENFNIQSYAKGKISNIKTNYKTIFKNHFSRKKYTRFLNLL